jgi:hypothetical protein
MLGRAIGPSQQRLELSWTGRIILAGDPTVNRRHGNTTSVSQSATYERKVLDDIG